MWTARALSFTRLRGLAVSAALALSVTAAHAAPAGVTIAQPWMRFLTPDIPAAGYFTLNNSSAREASLTGASSPACGQLMLHQSVVSNGAAHMQMVQHVAVPAHGSVTFRPGGYHLMCMQPSADVAPGKHVPVTLRFSDGAALPASFTVYGAKGK